MKIECPSCAAKYSIGDDKVQDRLAKIRCRKCGTTIVIDGKQNPPHIYAADAGSAAADVPGPTSSPSPSAGGEFTVDFGAGDQRNLTLAQVVSAYNKGEVTAEHYVWAEGFDDWRALGEVEQIVDALHVSARSPMAATPAAAVPRAAALGGLGGGGRGTDLFGGIEQAGSEEDVTTSAASPDPMHAAPAATGARNESSVLFSLSALTSAAATSKPSHSGGGLAGLASSPSTSSSKEDSGLIDLKALTAAAAATERRDVPAPMGLGLTPSPLGGVAASPLGLGSPLGGPTTAAAMSFDPGPMPQQKNRTGLYIAVGIVVAAVAVALIVVSSKEEPAPIPSATPIAAPAPTPTPAPIPTPTAESTAQPPATGTPTEDAGAPADDKKAPVASRSTWRPKKTTASTSSQAASKPAEASGGAKPPPKKKPASGGCGCAPGDLQCAMRCAAGG